MLQPCRQHKVCWGCSQYHRNAPVCQTVPSHTKSSNSKCCTFNLLFHSVQNWVWLSRTHVLTGGCGKSSLKTVTKAEHELKQLLLLLASSCICALLYYLPQTRRNRHLCFIISISRNTAISLFKQVKTTTWSWFQGPFSLILPVRDGWVPIYPWKLCTACIV